MPTIAVGQTVSVFCPLASSITVTPGTSGSVAVAVQSAAAPTFQGQTITAAKTFTAAANDRLSITAIGAAATYTDPAGVDTALQALVSGAGTYGGIAAAREVVGTPIFSWSNSGIITHAGTTPSSVIADTSLGDTATLRIPFSSGTRAGPKVALAAPIDLSARKAIRVVARNNGSATRTIQMRIGTTSGFTLSAYFYLAINPGVNVFYVDTFNGSMQGSATWAVNGAAMQHLWFVDLGSVESGYSNLTAGDSIDIGLVSVATSRPIFSFVTDDAKAANLHQGASYPTGYPVTGGTHFEILSAYGFKASIATTPEEVGDTGFLTAAELTRLEGQGWEVINNYHSSMTGLSQSAVADAVSSRKTALAAMGFTKATDCFTLPTGYYDATVLAGLADGGVKLARGIGAQINNTTSAFYRGFSHVCGQPGGYTIASNKLFWAPAGMCFATTSIQIDGALTTADVDAYITALKLNGGHGTCYIHDTSATYATLLDYLCSKVRTEVAAGALDVLMLSQVRDLYAACAAAHSARYA